MENKKINLIKPLSWVFILLIVERLYTNLIYIFLDILKHIEPAKSRLFLSNDLARVILTILLLIGYVTVSRQRLFQNVKGLKNKEIILLVFKCFCLFVIIDIVLRVIFVSTAIDAYIIGFADYKKNLPQLEAIFMPRYYPRFFTLSRLIISPIFEEIFFRRVMYDSIKRQSNSFIVAVILSSICFAMIHFNSNQNAIDNSRHLLLTFFVGIILSYCYERGGSIIPSMILHFMWNFCGHLDDSILPQYRSIFHLFLFLISLSIIGYVFVKYLCMLQSRQTSNKILNNSSKLLSRLRRKALLPILFFSCLFESLIVMQTIIMIFRLSVDYKIVWYASIQLAFFVVAVLYVRDCHVSLSDVLVKKSVNLNWSLIVKFLCATFVLCFVFFYLPNVSRFGSVISFFKNNNAVLDLSIFNVTDSSPIAFIIFIFIAPIIEQMIFKFGVHHFTKNKSRIIPIAMFVSFVVLCYAFVCSIIIPIAMFVSFVVFGLLYTLRLEFTLTELTVIFCIKLFLLYVHEKSESMLTCVVLQLFITVILFLNRYLFFVYSAPVFSALASVSVVVLGFTLIDFLRRRKLDIEHKADEVVSLDERTGNAEKAVVESSDLDE